VRVPQACDKSIVSDSGHSELLVSFHCEVLGNGCLERKFLSIVNDVKQLRNPVTQV